MLALVVAFSVSSSANRNSLMICLYLDLCLKPSEVENRAISAVSNVDSIIRASKYIKRYRRKHDTEKSVGQDTSLLNPIFVVKSYRAFFVVLHPCMHAVMKLSDDGDEFFGAAVFCHDSPKSGSADHVKCLDQISISRVEVNVLFLTLILQRSCSKYYVISPTFLREAACSRWLLRRFSRTMARILPEIESKEIMW